LAGEHREVWGAPVNAAVARDENDAQSTPGRAVPQPHLTDAARHRFICRHSLGPDRRDDVVLGHEPAGILDKIAQDGETLGSEGDLALSRTQGAPAQIERIAGRHT
jgi:hypothetical protein